LENGIQVKEMRMDPGFHRGDDNAGITGTVHKIQNPSAGKTTILKVDDFTPLMAFG
jgi:hypothetical protein